MPLNRSMTARRLLKIFAASALLALILFVWIGTAGAKGPVSVTITGPGIDRPLELMDPNNFDLVARLMEQSGLWYATGDLPRPIDKPAGELGPAYTLTWVNGGPPGKSVEDRTIRQLLYLEAESGPVIHTPEQDGLQGWGSGVTGWFAAPEGIRDTLSDLGVPDTSFLWSGGEAFLERVGRALGPGGRPFHPILILALGVLAIGVGWVVVRGARRLVGDFSP